MTPLDRNPISRAWFFMNKANECTVEQNFEFESYIEASIVFARSAILRMMRQHGYKKNKLFTEWLNSIIENPSIKFTKKNRDDILKEKPLIIGQIISFSQPTHARSLYYFNIDDQENPLNPILTLIEHLAEIKRILKYADDNFIQ